MTNQFEKHDDPTTLLRIEVAVLKQVSTDNSRKLDELKADITRAFASFATKDDLATARAEITSIKAGINWAVRVVIGFVIVGVIGLLIKAGAHP